MSEGRDAGVSGKEAGELDSPSTGKGRPGRDRGGYSPRSPSASWNHSTQMSRIIDVGFQLPIQGPVKLQGQRGTLSLLHGPGRPTLCSLSPHSRVGCQNLSATLRSCSLQRGTQLPHWEGDPAMPPRRALPLIGQLCHWRIGSESRRAMRG